MKIAVASHHRQLVGGTESYLHGIIPELERLGHEVILFHEAEVVPGAPTIAASRHSRDFSGFASFLPNVIFNQGLVSPALEYSLADSAPVVHFAHNYHGTCVSGEKTRKLPTPAACPRAFGPACLAQYLPRNCGGWNPLVLIADYQTQMGRRHAMRRAHTVVTASSHMRREYLHNGMHNVVQAPLFVSPAAEPLPDPPATPFRILFAGRMTRIKGASLLAAAAPQIRRLLNRPVHFTFAGDGPDRATAAALLPDAAFPGWLSQTLLADLARRHHLLAMPGLWPEPFGLAGLESRLPVVAFQTGGIPDWLTEGYNGALATPPTPQSFAEALVRCAQIPRARTNAHTVAQRFTIANHTDILLPILEAACAS